VYAVGADVHVVRHTKRLGVPMKVKLQHKVKGRVARPLHRKGGRGPCCAVHSPGARSGQASVCKR
jgi:hypothetical protein